MTVQQRKNKTSKRIFIYLCPVLAIVALQPAGRALAEQQGGTEVEKINVTEHKLEGEKQFKLAMKIIPRVPGSHEIDVQEKYSVASGDTNENGSATQIIKFGQAAVTMNGRVMDVLASMPVVTVSRSTAGVYSVKAEGGSSDGAAEISNAIQQITAMPEVLRPADALKPGASWKIDFANANLMIGAARLTGKAQFVGHEKLGGVDTLKIKFNAEGPGAERGKKLKTEGAVNIDAATGGLVSLNQKGSGIFAAGPADVEMEVKRISGS